MSIPGGYEPHFRKSKFTDPWEPIFSKIENDQVRLGVELRDVHCNSRGLVHGGFLATVADNAMGLSLGATLRAQETDLAGLVTLNLGLDYIGIANVGEWVSTDTTVLKSSGATCFASCIISTDSEHVARANATFRILKSI